MEWSNVIDYSLLNNPEEIKIKIRRMQIYKAIQWYTVNTDPSEYKMSYIDILEKENVERNVQRCPLLTYWCTIIC